MAAAGTGQSKWPAVVNFEINPTFFSNGEARMTRGVSLASSSAAWSIRGRTTASTVRTGVGAVLGLAATGQLLDDNHAGPAAGTWTRQDGRLVDRGGLGCLGLFRPGWDGEQLAHPL